MAKKNKPMEVGGPSIAEDIITLLTTRTFNQSEIEAINDALRVAYKNNRQVRLEAAQEEVHVGGTVQIEGIRPKNLNGSQGKVLRINGGWTRADIELTSTRTSMRRAGEVVSGVPLVCLKPIR